PLLLWRLVRRAVDISAFPEAWRGWVANPTAVAWLVGQGEDDLPHGARLIPPERFAMKPVLYPEEIAALHQFFELGYEHHLTSVEFELLGPLGSGRGTLSGQFAASKNKALLHVDGTALASGATEAEISERVVEAVRAATLRDSILFWDERAEPQAT